MLSFASTKLGSSFSFDKAALLPLVLKLGEFLKKGFDHYVQMRVSGIEVDPPMLAAFIEIQMDSWNPIVGGKAMLDPLTKKAAAQFIAGVAYNMAESQE
tara:strand:- start:442 stop:738 length:297 start_codon:yes stop_codon:yes gene_type:complete